MAERATKELRRRIGAIGLVVLLSVAFLGLGITIALASQGISFFSVRGESMEPTFKSGQTIVLQQERAIAQGQIIVFNKPKAWEYMGKQRVALIKRVGAVPGETLEYNGEAFLVNGEVIYNLADDDYKCEKGEEGYSHTLSGSEVFAIGDNPNSSLDSRHIFCDGDTKNMYVPYRNMIDYGQVKAQF